MIAPRHLAKLAFSPEFVVRLAQHGCREAAVIDNAVPPDAEVRGGGYDADTATFYVILEHPSYPLVHPGQLVLSVRQPVFKAPE
jgi:hypothetical protein